MHVSSGPEWAWGNMPVAMLNNPTEEKVVMRMKIMMTVAMLKNTIEEKVRWDGRQDLRVKSGRVCF